MFEKTFDVPISKVWRSRDMILLLETEEQACNIDPKFYSMRKITDFLGAAITAKGSKPDFVCRLSSGRSPIRNRGGRVTIRLRTWCCPLRKNMGVTSFENVWPASFREFKESHSFA